MSEIELQSRQVVSAILQIVNAARNRVATNVNMETTMLYYEIGKYLNRVVLSENRAEYGSRILATVSQELTQQLGRGYTYSALTRMAKVSRVFGDEIIAAVSQQLSWSHLIELTAIENEIKREFLFSCAYQINGA